MSHLLADFLSTLLEKGWLVLNPFVLFSTSLHNSHAWHCLRASGGDISAG
jgi:hypothetical protein